MVEQGCDGIYLTRKISGKVGWELRSIFYGRGRVGFPVKEQMTGG